MPRELVRGGACSSVRRSRSPSGGSSECAASARAQFGEARVAERLRGAHDGGVARAERVRRARPPTAASLRGRARASCFGDAAFGRRELVAARGDPLAVVSVAVATALAIAVAYATNRRTEATNDAQRSCCSPPRSWRAPSRWSRRSRSCSRSASRAAGDRRSGASPPRSVALDRHRRRARPGAREPPDRLAAPRRRRGVADLRAAVAAQGDPARERPEGAARRGSDLRSRGRRRCRTRRAAARTTGTRSPSRSRACSSRASRSRSSS